VHNFQTRENFQYDLQIQTLTVISDSTGIFCLILNLKHVLRGSCCADYTPTPNVPYGNILKQPNEAGSGAEFIPFIMNYLFTDLLLTRPTKPITF